MKEIHITMRADVGIETVVQEFKSLGWTLTGVQLFDADPDTDSVPTQPAPVPVGQQISPEPDEPEPVPTQTQPVEEDASDLVTGVSAPDLDVNGFPWDARIHASTKAKNQDGTWRYRKGVDEATKRQVEAELKGQQVGTESPSGGEPEETPDFMQEPVANMAAQAPAATRDEVTAAFKRLNEAKGLQTCMQVLSRFGAKNVSGLGEDQYGACVQLVDKVLAGGEV